MGDSIPPDKGENLGGVGIRVSHGKQQQRRFGSKFVRLGFRRVIRVFFENGKTSALIRSVAVFAADGVVELVVTEPADSRTKALSLTTVHLPRLAGTPSALPRSWADNALCPG